MIYLEMLIKTAATLMAGNSMIERDAMKAATSLIQNALDLEGKMKIVRVKPEPAAWIDDLGEIWPNRVLGKKPPKNATPLYELDEGGLL